MTTHDSDAARLRARIYSVIPAASYQMEKLLSLVDIACTEDVPTAAIECVERPRMLLNPRFIEASCRTDEHLFLLVMHELQHVVLGHTRLFPRATLAHNLAFDAVINALLCQQFPGREFTSFFQALNSWEEFPGRLLRPAPGWPERPQPLPADAGPEERRIHDLLYGRTGDITYHEIFELLTALLDDGEDTSPVLLGDHEGEHGDGVRDDSATRDATLRDVLRRVVEGWPPPRQRLGGRDTGRPVKSWMLGAPADPTRALRAAIRRLLARAGLQQHAWHGSRRLLHSVQPLEIETVLPQAGDRRAHALRRLTGAAPLLYRGSCLAPRTRREPLPVAHVYLDVSGSMAAALRPLAGALAPLHRARAIRLFVFSTVIGEVSPQDLLRQRLANTLGTDIRCVLQHLAALPRTRRPRRTVLITDGYVGAVAPDAFTSLGTALYVGLYRPLGAASHNDLAPAARHVELLPDLGGA